MHTADTALRQGTFCARQPGTIHAFWGTAPGRSQLTDSITRVAICVTWQGHTDSCGYHTSPAHARGRILTATAVAVTDTDTSNGPGLGCRPLLKAPASAARASVPAASVSMSHDSGAGAPASCHDVPVLCRLGCCCAACCSGLSNVLSCSASHLETTPCHVNLPFLHVPMRRHGRAVAAKHGWEHKALPCCSPAAARRKAGQQAVHAAEKKPGPQQALPYPARTYVSTCHVSIERRGLWSARSSMWSPIARQPP